MMDAVSGGVKAGVAGGVDAASGCVPQDAGDELIDRQVQRALLAAAVVEVGHAQFGCAGVLEQLEEAVRGNGRALGVASQVQHDTPAVVVGAADLDVPVLVPELAQLLAPEIGGQVRR